MNQKSCYCGLQKSFAKCCEEIISGTRQAATAEELMRSRYSAFVTGNSDYILKSWHESNRPVDLEKDEDENLDWLPLTIIKTTGGALKDDTGTVEFSTGYRENGKTFYLHEVSNFIKEKSEWFYLNGKVMRDSQHKKAKIGRNDPCPCNSGKKYKKCCG
ncbi:MAG: SEC-C domain-containing protein [Nitrospinae bacterium]|nr:SEC-C domain-containing protein [Nitrospinota bacterium]